MLAVLFGGPRDGDRIHADRITQTLSVTHNTNPTIAPDEMGSKEVQFNPILIEKYYLAGTSNGVSYYYHPSVGKAYAEGRILM